MYILILFLFLKFYFIFLFMIKKTELMKRFIMTTFSLYLILAVIVSVIHVLFEYKNIRDQIQDDLQSIYVSASEPLAANMWSMDPTQVESVMHGLLTLNFVTGVDIQGDVESLNFSKMAGDPGNSLQYQGPIIYSKDNDERVLGTITLYSDQSVIVGRIKVNVIFIIANAFIKTFFLSVIMLIVGARIIDKPLESLLSSVKNLDLDDIKKIEASKLTEIDSEKDQKSELNELVSAYNQTLDHVLKRTRQRNEDREELEHKNVYLESLVDEKTLALQNKIDELNEANQELQTLASTDYLTSVLNRRSFFERARIELSRLSREKQKACVLIIDIDFFKSINDRYGHPAGDALLVVIAKILKNNIRQHDLVSRFGGEEFAIFLIDISIEGAIDIAERMRKNIERQKVIFKGDVIKATASFGLSMIGHKNNDIDAALADADKLLYEAKESGRNRLKY